MGLDPDLRSLQEVRDLVARARVAHEAVAHYSQAEIDDVCRAMVNAAVRSAHNLAKVAVEETGIGRVHYKVLKNLFAAEGTWESIRNEGTVGVISRDRQTGVVEVATPVGVVAGVVPTTNPTSTAIFKALIAVKGRNALVLSPHPRSRRCIAETTEVLRRAIERTGAPPDLVTCLTNPTIESTGALMKHRDVALILATGGSGLVKAAYSSGKPAYGVGPGNVPVYVDRSAKLADVARWLVSSQSFDNATFCCSEQALVVDRPVAERLLALLQKRGAHLCTAEETAQLARFCNRGGHMAPEVVGQDPWRVAEMAGFRVPRATSLLLAFQDGVGKEHPLSIEILCPLLSVHVVDGWEAGCETSTRILEYGGLGHTLGVWAEDERVLDAFFLEKPANRIVVNGPTSQGAVGYSTRLVPSVSLGCGPQAGNITSDNISARHLVNVKRAAFPRQDWEAIDARDHERVARWTGEAAPRGSGLPGDPAGGASGATAASTPATARTSSTPPYPYHHDEPVPVPEPVPAAVEGSSRAPRFTQTASAVENPRSFTRSAPPREAAPLAEPVPKSSGSGPYVGMALEPEEIEGILAHAGAGCPLGPCQGCPHSDTLTGACRA